MQDVTVTTSDAADPAAGLQSRAGALARAVPAEARAAPRTAQELAALRRQRDETTEQLTGTHQRRSELLEEMRQNVAGDQDPLRAQMVELDRRVLLLETDLTNVDHLIATAPAGLGVEARAWRAVGTVQPRGFVLLGPGGPSPNAVPALLLLVTLLQVVLLLRARVRRAPSALADPAAREAAARLARVEQAVDAIAVEVERVSEGQRFVSRLLSEQAGAATRVAPSPRQHRTPA